MVVESWNLGLGECECVTGVLNSCFRENELVCGVLNILGSEKVSALVESQSWG